MHCYLISFESADEEVVSDIKKYIHTFNCYASIQSNVYIVMTNASTENVNPSSIRNSINNMIDKDKKYQLFVMKASYYEKISLWSSRGMTDAVASYLNQFA